MKYKIIEEDLNRETFLYFYNTSNSFDSLSKFALEIKVKSFTGNQLLLGYVSIVDDKIIWTKYVLSFVSDKTRRKIDKIWKNRVFA